MVFESDRLAFSSLSITGTSGDNSNSAEYDYANCITGVVKGSSTDTPYSHYYSSEYENTGTQVAVTISLGSTNYVELVNACVPEISTFYLLLDSTPCA